MNPTEEHMITAALGGGSEISTEVLATLAEIGEDVNASLDLDYVTRDQQNILTLLASRLAIAIENARLFEKVKAQADTLLLLSEVGRETSAILDVEELLRRAAEQTKRVIDYQILSIMLYDEEQKVFRHRVDVKHGQSVQGRLRRPVPTEDYGVDLAARYLSAREVCGDLYDLLRYGPQQLGIALGDVSGKGTAAALYGAVAIGIMRSLAPQKLQPAEMLKQMNQLVGERRIEGRFMTACFATWQKGRQKLRVANAGQSQPLLYKDHRCGKIELTGFPLGIYEDVAYDEWGVTLEPGNILVFHSDGITETANSEGQFFGTTRLRELIEKHHVLTAAELADKILGEVDWISRSAPRSDDRRQVVMNVRRAIQGL